MVAVIINISVSSKVANHNGIRSPGVNVCLMDVQNRLMISCSAF